MIDVLYIASIIKLIRINLIAYLLLDRSKFREKDSKFKDVYFVRGTSVKMGLLVDPKNQHIWIYKRNPNTNISRRRKMSRWQNVDLNDCLPGFTLHVNRLEIEPLEVGVFIISYHNFGIILIWTTL